MSETIETLPVGCWAYASRRGQAIVVYREDESHWCDAAGRSVNVEGATWSGMPSADPPTPNQAPGGDGRG